MKQRKLLIWLGIIFFILLFFYAVKDILLPFVIGMMLAYLLDPLADALERRKFSRTMATAIITIGALLVFIGGMIAIAPLIAQQAQDLLTDIPQLVDSFMANVQPYINRALAFADAHEIAGPEEAITASTEKIGALAGSVVTGVFASGLAILNLLSLLLIAPVVTFYLLRDWDILVAKIYILLPRDYAETIREQLREIDITLAGFLRGQLNVCLVLATYYTIALQLAGLKYALVVGILSGFLILIPYAGTIVSGLLSVGLAYVQFGQLEPVAIIAAIFFLGQLVEGNYLVPKLVGSRIGIHPVWLIFGMMAGGSLFGFLGVLLAVPLTAIIGVLIRFAMKQYLHSSLYAEPRAPATPK